MATDSKEKCHCQFYDKSKYKGNDKHFKKPKCQKTPPVIRYPLEILGIKDFKNLSS